MGGHTTARGVCRCGSLGSLLLVHLLDYLLWRNVVVHSLPRGRVILWGLVVALGRVVLEARIGVVVAGLLLLGGIVSTTTLPTLLLLLMLLGVSLVLTSVLLLLDHLLGHLQGHLLRGRLDGRRLLLAHHRHLLHLHLLHHGGIHAGHLLRHILHRLLHHGGVDGGHGSTATHLGHCRHVALHLLPVLCHHLRGHTVVGRALLLLRSALWSVAALRAVHVVPVAAPVAVIETITISTITESSTTTTVIPLVHVPASRVSPWLRLLDLNLLAHNRQRRAIQRILDGRLAIERDESEAPWSSSILVHHEGSIKDTSELEKVFSEIRFRGLLADTADKDLRSFLLLISRDRTLGINLPSHISNVISA